MLKLNASYSKKVPAEQEYSSKSYHVSLEVELPAGLTADQLQDKISETFALARESVETEIHGNTHNGNAQVINTTPAPAPRQLPARAGNGSNGGHSNNRSSNEPASNKQIGFLTDIIKRSGYDMNAILSQQGVSSLYDLSRKQCSRLIDGLQQSGQRAA